MAAEQGPDVADDAGLIVVSDDQQGAFERRFDGHAVDENEPAASVLEHGPFDLAIAFVGVEFYRDEARVVAWAATARLDELYAALGCHRPRIHWRDAPRREDG